MSNINQLVLEGLSSTNPKVYDKVKWHHPDGKAPSLESAMVHHKVVMDWLHKNNLHSDHGKEVHSLGIGADHSLNSNMVTPVGKKVLDDHYDKFLSTIDYKTHPNTSGFDKSLAKYKR